MQAKSSKAVKQEVPAFQQYQLDFSAHIRNPKENPRPQGVEARRMKIYNELLYNNLEGFLLACFPVLQRILGSRKWAKLVREFFAEHQCHTPFFRQIPDEFVQYLQNERGTREDDPHFLQDLAHYEWIELILSVSAKEIDLSQINEAGDLMDGQPVLNPILSLQTYNYAVHRISPKFKPTAQQKETTHIAILRNRDDAVKFVLVNAVSKRFLELLLEKAQSGREALLQIAKELNHPNPEVVLAGGQEMMQSLKQAEVILGVSKNVGCET